MRKLLGDRREARARTAAIAAAACAVMACAVMATLGGVQHAAAQTTSNPALLPDLVIVQSRSNVRFVSCEEGPNLAEGTIIVENIGATSAQRGGGGAFSTFLTAYVPHNIDFIAREEEFNLLDPFEAASISFEMGEGRRKRGRLIDRENFGGGFDGVFDPDDLEPVQIEQIQRALSRIGLYQRPIDGVYGSGTRAAIRNFSVIVNQTLPTDTLTAGLAQLLSQRSGVNLTILGGNYGSENNLPPSGIFTIDLFVMVDPLDLVRESNELNNLVNFPLQVDCRRTAPGSAEQ